MCTTSMPRNSKKTKGTREDMVLVYGKHPVAEALRRHPEAVQEVFLDPHSGTDALRARAKEAGIPVAPWSALAARAGAPAEDAVHQGAAARVRTGTLLLPYGGFIANVPKAPSTLLVVLAEVQDPHNVGAVIRSAAAFGAAGVLLPAHRQAPVTGAVVKSSAGAACLVPLVRIGNVATTLAELKCEGCWAYGLAGGGTVPLQREEFTRPSVLVVGNEHYGLRPRIRDACDLVLSIPQHPRCESLNVSAAAAVALYEWSRAHPEALGGA